MKNRLGRLAGAAMALALFAGGAARAGEDGEAAAPDLDWDALGQMMGGGDAAVPAWQQKMQEFGPLVQQADEAVRAGKDDEARAAMAKMDEMLADPEIPPHALMQPMYILGSLRRQAGDAGGAKAAFEKMIQLADGEGMEMFGRDALKAVALLELAQIAAVDENAPPRALEFFARADALAEVPPELRSTLAARQFDLRARHEAIYDAEAMRELVRRELAWSVFPPGPNSMPDPRLPGHLAAAAALGDQAGEARAILAAIEAARGPEDAAAGEMAPALLLAYAYLDDAEGAARWLAKDLEYQAMQQAPKAFLKALDGLEAAHFLRTVKGAEGVAGALKEYRDKAELAREENRRTVTAPPEPPGGFPAFGG